MRVGLPEHTHAIETGARKQIEEKYASGLMNAVLLSVLPLVIAFAGLLLSNLQPPSGSDAENIRRRRNRK